MEIVDTKNIYYVYDNIILSFSLLLVGDEGMVFGTNGSIAIDALIAPFKEKGGACENLAGKPKLFFIQVSFNYSK